MGVYCVWSGTYHHRISTGSYLFHYKDTHNITGTHRDNTNICKCYNCKFEGYKLNMLHFKKMNLLRSLNCSTVSYNIIAVALCTVLPMGIYFVMTLIMSHIFKMFKFIVFRV